MATPRDAKVHGFRWLLVVAVVLGSTGRAGAASAPPAGAHPRLWLDAETLGGLRSAAADPDSAVGRARSECEDVRANPSEWRDGGWQGFVFVDALASCLLSYVAAGDGDDLDTALAYFSVLLDDYQTVGDGLGGDTVVRHDTGYAIRTFAPYAALAYDWLHDAPGMTEELRAHARARFAAWTGWYASDGYLVDVPGANYHAGWVFAATLIAIAEAGEAGAEGDVLWTSVVDDVWGTVLAPAFADGGVLAMGDWPEGWQYGPLSVLELATAARALEEQGVTIPGAARWAGQLILRNLHALTPATKQVFPGGDADVASANMRASLEVPTAVVVGPAPEPARAWARALRAELTLAGARTSGGWANLYAALAEVRAGPASPYPADAATSLRTGAGNYFVRGAWTDATPWAVFQCAGQLVPDHDHPDAGNFVLSRGADDLVVDPSPYGALSTLTSNAPAVDSHVLPEGYSPSQGPWGTASGFDWAFQSESGIAAARCRYDDNFRLRDTPSDVPVAVRDLVLVPVAGSADATLVVIDRVATAQAEQTVHLRVRTPGTLALAGGTATTTIGASSLRIDRLYSSSGAPTVRDMPLETDDDACWMNLRTCDKSRLPSGQEVRLDLAGPRAFAIHVLDATAAGEVVPPAEMRIGAGFRLIDFTRGGRRIAVVTDDTVSGRPGGSLVYRAAAASTQVVVDAPADASGASQVTAVAVAGGECEISVAPGTATAGAGGAAGAAVTFASQPLIFSLSSACAVTPQAAQPAAPSVGAADDTGDDGQADSESGSGGASGGCHVVVRSTRAADGSSTMPIFLLAFALGLLAAHGWRSARRSGSQRTLPGWGRGGAARLGTLRRPARPGGARACPRRPPPDQRHSR